MSQLPTTASPTLSASPLPPPSTEATETRKPPPLPPPPPPSIAPSLSFTQMSSSAPPPPPPPAVPQPLTSSLQPQQLLSQPAAPSGASPYPSPPPTLANESPVMSQMDSDRLGDSFSGQQGVSSYSASPPANVSTDRFSIDGSDSDSSDDAGHDGGADSGDEAADPSSGGNDETRRAHKQKMLALSELMRATTTEMPEFDDEGEDEDGADESPKLESIRAPARLSSSAQAPSGQIRRSSAAARLSSVNSDGVGGSPGDSARFGSLERRELRPNERASLVGSGGKQSGGRLRESMGSGGGKVGRRRLSLGASLGMFGKQTVVVRHGAEFGSGHTDINRLVNFDYAEASARESVAATARWSPPKRTKSQVSHGDSPQQHVSSPSSLGTSSLSSALGSLSATDPELLPPLPLPTVDLGPLLARRTRAQAALYRTPRPVKVCCMTWNANGRMVGPEVLQDWLVEALTEQQNTATKGGKAAGRGSTVGGAAGNRNRGGSPGGTVAAAHAAAANAGAHQKGAGDAMGGMGAASVGYSGATVAAAETKGGEDDDSNTDEEGDLPGSLPSTASTAVTSALDSAAAPPVIAPALTPDEFVELNELSNKDFLNDDESDRLQSLMAAQKNASTAAPPPPSALPPIMAAVMPFEAPREPSIQGGEDHLEGSSGTSNDGMYAKLRESVSPFVPQRSKVVKRCRGCGEGTSKPEREVCKTCGASNDWSTIVKGTSATGGGGGLSSSANSSSSSLDKEDIGGSSHGENADVSGMSGGGGAAFQKSKKKKGLLGKLFASDNSGGDGDDIDSSSHTIRQGTGTNMVVADVITIALQEIIELSAANVVVESMTDNGSREATGNWVTNITAALQLVSEKLASEQAQDGRQGLLAGSSAWSGSYSYQLVAESHMVGIALLVFVRSPLQPMVSHVQKCIVPTGKAVPGALGKGAQGAALRLGNKGAVCVRLNVCDASMCFVSSHLAANTKYFAKRNANVADVCAAQPFVRAVRLNPVARAADKAAAAAADAAKGGGSASEKLTAEEKALEESLRHKENVEKAWKMLGEKTARNGGESPDRASVSEEFMRPPKKTWFSFSRASTYERKSISPFATRRSKAERSWRSAPEPKSVRPSTGGAAAATRARPATNSAASSTGRTSSSGAAAADAATPTTPTRRRSSFVADAAASVVRMVSPTSAPQEEEDEAPVYTVSAISPFEKLTSKVKEKGKDKATNSSNGSNSSGGGSSNRRGSTMSTNSTGDNSGAAADNDDDDESAGAGYASTIGGLDANAAAKALRKRLGIAEATALNHFGVLDHDLVFWLGDLNYRLDESQKRFNFEFFHQAIQAQRCDALLPADQLSQQRAAGNVFVGFEEAPLTFPPTYKFIPGTDIYDRRPDKKKRAPAWCDRVLWREAPLAKGLGTASMRKVGKYAPLARACPSDHVPVGALFDLEVCVKQPRDAFLELCAEELLKIRAVAHKRRNRERAAAGRPPLALAPAMGPQGTYHRSGSADWSSDDDDEDDDFESDELPGMGAKNTREGQQFRFSEMMAQASSPSLSSSPLSSQANTPFLPEQEQEQPPQRSRAASSAFARDNEGPLELPPRIRCSPSALTTCIERLALEMDGPMNWTCTLSNAQLLSNARNTTVSGASNSNSSGNGGSSSSCHAKTMSKEVTATKPAVEVEFEVDPFTVPDWLTVSPTKGRFTLGGPGAKLKVATDGPVSLSLFQEFNVGHDLRALISVRVGNLSSPSMNRSKPVLLAVCIHYQPPLRLEISSATRRFSTSSNKAKRRTFFSGVASSQPAGARPTLGDGVYGDEDVATGNGSQPSSPLSPDRRRSSVGDTSPANSRHSIYFNQGAKEASSSGNRSGNRGTGAAAAASQASGSPPPTRPRGSSQVDTDAQAPQVTEAVVF